MSEIGDMVKLAALRAVEASYPMQVVFGTVAAVHPIRIRTEIGHEVDEDFLIKTEAAVDHLETGDRVVLIRMQGGQQFLFIDRLVE